MRAAASAFNWWQRHRPILTAGAAVDGFVRGVLFYIVTGRTTLLRKGAVDPRREATKP